MLYFPHSTESCCLERLFSFKAQTPLPAEAVRARMLGGDALVGKLSCPKICQAALLPGQPPPAHYYNGELPQSTCSFPLRH